MSSKHPGTLRNRENYRNGSLACKKLQKWVPKFDWVPKMKSPRYALSIKGHVTLLQTRESLLVSLPPTDGPLAPHVNMQRSRLMTTATQPPAMQPPASLGTGCRARTTIDCGVTKHRNSALHLSILDGCCASLPWKPTLR